MAGATVGGLWGGAEGIEGRYFVDFADPEGQRLRLANDSEEGVAGLPGGIPWEGSTVPREVGIRDLVAVDLTVRDLEPTARVLEKVLGFRRRYEHRES